MCKGEKSRVESEREGKVKGGERKIMKNRGREKE